MYGVWVTSPRPLRADAERNRLRLLASAEVVFAERGLHATLDDIAAHAGVGVGTAYRRFANKQEVIEALFELRTRNMIELAEECAAMPDAGAGFVRFVQETCTAMSSDRGFRDVLMRGTSSRDKFALIRENLTPVMARLVEQAQAAGTLRADFHALDLPLVILMMDAVVDATDRLDPQLWQRYLAIVLDGLLRGSSAGGRPLPGQPLTSEQTELAFSYRHNRP